MTAILLVLLLFWVAAMVLFYAGAAWLQGYLYSEPSEGLAWRGPVAGTAVTLVLGIWCFFDFRAPGDFPAVYQFSTSREKTYDELWAVNKDGKKIHYRGARDASGKPQFRDDANRPMPSRPQSVIVKDEGEEVPFEPERDSQGKFKSAQGASLVYTDSQGRTMNENNIGSAAAFRPGLLFGNVFLNLLLLVVLFACHWLVLRFQWTHALGMAVVVWLVLAIIVVPMLTSKAEEAARTQPPAASSASEAPVTWRLAPAFCRAELHCKQGRA